MIYEPYLRRQEQRELARPSAMYEPPAPHDKYWPFDGPPASIPSSYADRLWMDPWLAFQLQHPIEAATGFWRHGRALTTSQTGGSFPLPQTPIASPRR